MLSIPVVEDGRCGLQTQITVLSKSRAAKSIEFTITEVDSSERMMRKPDCRSNYENDNERSEGVSGYVFSVEESWSSERMTRTKRSTKLFEPDPVGRSQSRERPQPS